MTKVGLTPFMQAIPESRTVITLDTGMSGTGIAIWLASSMDELEPPLGTGNVYPTVLKSVALHSANNSWWFKAASVMGHLRKWLDEWRPELVVAEFPEFFQSSARGHAATAEGDTYKMAYFAGCIGEWCTLAGVEYKLITPREWKGQTSKETIERRIRTRLSDPQWEGWDAHLVAHAVDAVGMGLWLKGYLHNDR